MLPFLLIIFGFTIPTIIFYIAPFGETIENSYLMVLIFCNLLALLGTLFYPIFNSSLKSKNTLFLNHDLLFKLKLLILIITFINIYIYLKIGFRLAVLDISIRSEIYLAAGYAWFLLISFSMTAALLYGVVKRYKLKIKFWLEALVVINILCLLGYGMKSNALQVILCFFVGSFENAKNINGISETKTRYYLKLTKLSIIILIVFWILNSLRSGKAYTLIDFVMLIYYYLIPPFSNFGNIISKDFSSDLFLGGILEGLYKIFFIKSNPLGQLDLNYLEHQTWNVWGFFANFYTSGGYFELYFGCFLIGIYAAYSSSIFKKRNSIFARMNFAQMLILCLTLHNSYYYQSFSPILAIFICLFLLKHKSKYISSQNNAAQIKIN